jgi:hypothetical protein
MQPWPEMEKTGLFSCYKVFDSTDDACDLIISISEKWADFWPKSHGWAPPIAADLMKQELMDRQLEMARALKNWPKRLLGKDNQGELILAWANLGSVIEGALKLYMCVFYADWLRDTDAPTKNNGDIKKTPDGSKAGATFEEIIQFVTKKSLFKEGEIDFIRLVQKQRNLIHPLKAGIVANRSAFDEAVIHTAALHNDIELRLPDP